MVDRCVDGCCCCVWCEGRAVCWVVFRMLMLTDRPTQPPTRLRSAQQKRNTISLLLLGIWAENHKGFLISSASIYIWMCMLPCTPVRYLAVLVELCETWHMFRHRLLATTIDTIVSLRYDGIWYRYAAHFASARMPRKLQWESTECLSHANTYTLQCNTWASNRD